MVVCVVYVGKRREKKVKRNVKLFLGESMGRISGDVCRYAMLSKNASGRARRGFGGTVSVGAGCINVDGMKGRERTRGGKAERVHVSERVGMGTGEEVLDADADQVDTRERKDAAMG